MITDDVFYTKTMAKVYADQGSLDKAAEIYRYLLQKEPQRQDLAAALSDIDKQRFNTGSEGLVDLFSIWLDLLLAYGRLRKLKTLQKRLK